MPRTQRNDDEPFVYARLVADLEALIRTGTLRPGERLPSVRRMSVQRGVSIATVLQAYRVLEARRRIGARPQSGFYVLSAPPAALIEPGPADGAGDPAEITSGDLIMRVLEMVADPTLMPLGTALPEPALLPTAELSRCLARIARRQAGHGAGALAPSGVEALRQQIAVRALEAGCALSADDVVITSGAAEAISLSLRALTRPGDTVVVESPAYFGTLQAIEALGLRALEVSVDPLTGIRLDLLAEALERGGVSAVVVTPNVHNPLGCTMPDEHKAELVRMLARSGVPAIEDDTYGELHFSGARPRSLRAFDGGAGMVITCGSFSKTLAPSYRVGWTVPGPWRDRILHHKLATTAATSAPPQLALSEYLASRGYDRHLRQLRHVLRGTVERFAVEVAERFPAGTRISRPAGGFLLWVQLPDGSDTVELQQRALKRGLSVAPGPAFSASGYFRNYLRINAGYRWSDRTRDALDLVAGMIRDQLAR